ncbi:MAG TPA: VCBS repeat-containing protein [Myxococcales bacterium]
MSLLAPAALAALILAADPVPPRGLPPEDLLDTWDEHAEDVEFFLKKRWCGAIKADARKVEKLLDANLVAPDLAAAKEEPYGSGAWTSRRITLAGEPGPRKPADFAAALERYFAPIAVRSRCSVGFHFFVLSKGEPRVAEARFQMLVAGLGPDGAHVQDSGEVRVELERDPKGKGLDAWRVARIGFEERIRVSSDWSHFQNVTLAARIPADIPEPNASANAQFYGDNLDRGGLAVGDVDGDGLDDLFVSGEKVNLLLFAKPDGTFEDRAKKWGVASTGDSRGVLLLDLDNDGDLDLVLATRGAQTRGEIGFYKNEKGKFTKVQSLAGPPPSAYLHLTAGDVNGDGLVDVFAGAYGVFAGAMPKSLLDSQDGAQDVLAINKGKLKFVDEAVKWGLKERGWTQSAVLVDLDGDGKVDLVAADDFGRKRIHRNVGGRFENVGEAAGPGTERANGMSVEVADLDGDGILDLYFGNMHSNAGQRISHGFVGGPPELRARLDAATRGNTLWLGEPGGLKYHQAGVELGVNDGGWSYGVQMFDADDDGWLEVHSPCGFQSSEREDEL